MTKVKISAIITSGGNSTRFGSNKLLEYIKDKTVIETTILKFVNLVDEIIVPAQDEVKEYLLTTPLASKIKFALPGETRQKSVFNGLMACCEPKIVLIHDGARPFIDKETIKKTIELTKEKHAVVVGFFATDTMKQVVEGKILETIDRRFIFNAQTPQAFDFELIKKVHELYKDGYSFTDDSSMLEAYGVDVYILEDSKSNIKITTKDDLTREVSVV